MKNYSISLLLALFTSAAGAGHAEATRTDINPALTYYQAFNVRPELSNADRDYLLTNEWRGQKLPDRFGQLLGQYDHSFNLARQAAHSTAACDWGIDWSAGPNTLLPHLGRIKNMAQIARLRAMWDLQQGRPTGARDDLLAAVAMGRYGSQDGSLIATLVQIAVERIACATVAENFVKFSPDILQQIADGLNEPPARGTVAACMPLEKAGFADWTVARLQQLQKENPGDDAKAIDGIREIFIGTDESGQPATNRWPQMVAASGGTVAGMIKLVRDMDPLYARITELEGLPFAQFQAQIKGFVAEIEKSTNPFAQDLLPALEKCRAREFGVLTELAMVQAAVQYKLRGAAGLQSVTDPCGQGPFGFQRFIFDGVDRGFQLSSPYDGQGFPAALIFVETDGPPFYVDAKKAGQAAQ